MAAGDARGLGRHGATRARRTGASRSVAGHERPAREESVGVTSAGPLDWVACSFALAGSLLLAVRCRVSAWGWVGFLLSNLAWIVYAIATGSPSLLAQNLGFTVTSLIGIYRHRADLRATAGAVAQVARRNFSPPIR